MSEYNYQKPHEEKICESRIHLVSFCLVLLTIVGCKSKEPRQAGFLNVAHFRADQGPLALVSSGGKYGFIGGDGKYVINPQFDSAEPFSEGLTLIKIGDKYTFITPSGTQIVNPQFDGAFPFMDGVALVKIGKNYGFIDKMGHYTINPQFDDAMPFVDGLAAVSVNNKWGFIDKLGRY